MSPHWLLGVIATMAAVSSPVPARGQHRSPIPLDSIRLGAHLRVEPVSGGQLQGMLLARSDSGIVLKAGFDFRAGRTPDTTYALLRANIERGVVRTGSRWKTGAIAGGTVLGVVGLCLGVIVTSDEELDAGFWTIPFLSATGVVVGGVVGAGVGHVFKTWTPIDLRRP